jgi:hypothetical protein
MSAESQTCEAVRQPLLVNSFADAPVAGQWPSSCHMMAATDTHTTTEELLEALFSLQSAPRLYNGDQLPFQVDPCGGGVEYLHCDPASHRR